MSYTATAYRENNKNWLYTLNNIEASSKEEACDIIKQSIAKNTYWIGNICIEDRIKSLDILEVHEE
jgi:hypothetical protein